MVCFDAFHLSEHREHVPVDRVFDEPILLDDPEPPLSQRRSAEKFPITPMEEVSPDGSRDQRFPYLTRNGFRLTCRRTIKKRFGAAVASFRNHHWQPRLLLIFSDTEI